MYGLDVEVEEWKFCDNRLFPVEMILSLSLPSLVSSDVVFRSILKFAFGSGTSGSSSPLLFCKNENLRILALKDVFFILSFSSSTPHAIVTVLSYPMKVAFIGLLSSP